MLKREKLLALCLVSILLSACTPKANVIALASTYSDGDVTISLNEQRTGWTAKIIGKQYTLNPATLDFEDVNGHTHKATCDGDVIRVNLLGEQRVMKPCKTDADTINPSKSKTVYNLGCTKAQLALYDNHKFTFMDYVVSGAWFETTGSGILFISDNGESVEQFYSKDDFIFGEVCEGSLTLTPKKSSYTSVSGYTANGDIHSPDGNDLIFSEDGTVLIGESKFSYSISERGLISIYSSIDGMQADTLYVTDDGNVYRVVFTADSMSTYLSSVTDTKASEDMSTLEAVDDSVDGSTNKLWLYITAALPSATVTESQKLQQLKAYQDASANEEKQETIEVSNFRDVLDRNASSLLSDEALEKRVANEVGEENMAPTGDNGEALITLDKLAPSNKELNVTPKTTEQTAPAESQAQ